MLKKTRFIIVFILSLFVLIFSTLFCLLNTDHLLRPVFQKTTGFMVASTAKYERDGNLYVIDGGAFRLICMTPEGKINYTINIKKMKEYVKIYDFTVDGEGNLYVYMNELEYNAYLTKRDMIKKYDRKGNFVKDIHVVNYERNTPDQPHTFPEYGSMRFEDGVLTFSRVRADRVDLYAYDTYRDKLDMSVFSGGFSNYSVARLALRDFDNFIYTTRSGDIYEVQNGSPPLLRASFNFTEDGGGIIPWQLNYDANGDIVFLDMASSVVFRLNRYGEQSHVLPQAFFNDLRAQGILPSFTDFGFFENRFAGVYGDVVWYYDGTGFVTYQEGVTLSPSERISIITVQVSFALGILALLLGIYVLFFHIMDRYISLLVKQIVFIIPLTIAAVVILYTMTFNLMKERLNKEIFNELLVLAATSAELIDGDDVEALKSLKDFNSETYRKLSGALKRSVGDNRDAWNQAYYAAIYKVIDNVEYFMLMSSDEKNMFRPYAAIEEGSGEYELLTGGKAFADIVDYVDGTWAYSNVPLYNSRGSIAGIFEIGLDMTSYEISNALQRQKISLIAMCICLTILLALAGIISFIIKQLRMVVKVLSAITSGDYSVRVRYKAKDELGSVSYGLNNMAEELEKQIKQITSLNESTIRFVPIQFMEHLGVTDITKMKLGDYVQRDLTVLFFDIRAFSINSEMMTARENFLFINKVLGLSGPIIREHKGFVDKFLGDAAMALFVDARDAVRAGIEVYRKLVLDKTTMIKVGVDGINIGIGIHTGSVMMGIVGENERLSSTVISKNVNLASRIESLTKQTKSGMLISRDTLNQIANSEDEFQYRFIGMIQAAGVNEVIGLYDIFDALPEGTRKRRLATKKVFESGVRKYHMKDYQGAYKRFEQVVNADSGDVCAVNCLEETQKRLKNPKLPSVFVFEKK